MLSKSVADGLSYYGDPDTKATEQFCRIMDRFFDCLNVRCLEAWKEKKKNDLKPYTDPNDRRLQVMEVYTTYEIYFIMAPICTVAGRRIFKILE